ncbi:hypothetical protein AAVH_25666 [Aphelenchoides avenae]|nr:hypothetical protein AAVH_25666 [Aphelenchus avenae]
MSTNRHQPEQDRNHVVLVRNHQPQQHSVRHLKPTFTSQAGQEPPSTHQTSSAAAAPTSAAQYDLQPADRKRVQTVQPQLNLLFSIDKPAQKLLNLLFFIEKPAQKQLKLLLFNEKTVQQPLNLFLFIEKPVQQPNRSSSEEPCLIDRAVSHQPNLASSDEPFLISRVAPQTDAAQTASTPAVPADT